MQNVPNCLILGVITALWPINATYAAEPRHLVFCFDPYPPFTLGDEGKAEGGYGVQLLDAVVAQLPNVTAEAILMPWQRCHLDAKSGEVDGILPLFKSEERESYLTFSDESYTQTSVFFYNQSRFPDGLAWQDDFEALSSLQLGMISGSIINAEMEEAFEAKGTISRAASPENLMQMLQHQRVDLVAIEASVGQLAIEKLGFSRELVPAPHVISSRTSYFGLAKATGADQYVNAFNAVLETLHQDGAIERIFAGAP